MFLIILVGAGRLRRRLPAESGGAALAQPLLADFTVEELASLVEEQASLVEELASLGLPH